MVISKANIQNPNKINKTEIVPMKRQNNYLNGSSNHKKKEEINSPEGLYQTPRSHSSKCYDNLQQTKSMFYSTFSNHAQECLCKQCLCGRHLCKINSPSPSLSLSTTYKQHYPPRKPSKYRNNPQRPFSARQSNNPLLTFSSTYRDHYNQLNPDELTRPKPKDLLGCGGPAMELSMYNQQFPGHRGKNQYIPVNPQLFRGGLPFSGSTTYSKQYGRSNGRSSDKAKPPDQFSMGGSWLGESTYRDQYKNPSYHGSPNKSKKQQDKNAKSKGDQIPNKLKNPSSHFKTTYHSDFKQKDLPICPAASIIENESQRLTKSNFKQNSNFKLIDGNFASLAKNGSFFG